MTIDLGPLAAIEEGRIGVVRAGAREIAYVRQGERVYAFRNLCPHQLARLSLGRVARRLASPKVGELELSEAAPVVRCPWHSWEFDLCSGRSVLLGDDYRFAVYPVEVEEGRARIQIGRGGAGDG